MIAPNNSTWNKPEMTFSHLKREHAEHVKYDIYETIKILATHHFIRPDNFESIQNAS